MRLKVILFLFTLLTSPLLADDASDLQSSTDEIAARMEAAHEQADTMELCLWLGFWTVIGGAVGAAIGSRKGKRGAGFFLGLLLGPLGWILIVVSKGDRINCPSCRELIDPMAMVCPKCHAKLVDENKPMPFERWLAMEGLSDDAWKHQRRSVSEEAYRQYVITFRPPGSVKAALPSSDQEDVPPPPPRRELSSFVRVAKDGIDLGQITPQEICDLITSGELTLQDHFYDASAHEWLTLDRCPVISVG